MLRRWNYRNYYYLNVTGAEEEHMLSHVGMKLPILLLVIPGLY